MVEPYDPYKKPQDIGAGSPASGEAKRQGISGARGGPRQARTRGISKQPAQTSGRRSVRHQQAPMQRKSFAPEENPAEQGTGEPSPERLRARSREQGIEPRSGSHAAHGERTQERSIQGPPDAGHTRYGRQKVPGQPERPIPPERDPEEFT
jgi:hypothetical protein